MNRFFLFALFLLITCPEAFSQESNRLSIFRVYYSEFYGQDVSESAMDRSQAIMFNTRGKHLELNRVCLDDAEGIYGYLEPFGRATYMERKEEGKWMLVLKGVWYIDAERSVGWELDEAVETGVVLSFRKDKDTPFLLQIRTINTEGGAPELVMEAELHEGSEGWEKMMIEWKANAEHMDTPE